MERICKIVTARTKREATEIKVTSSYPQFYDRLRARAISCLHACGTK